MLSCFGPEKKEVKRKEMFPLHEVEKVWEGQKSLVWPGRGWEEVPWDEKVICRWILIEDFLFLGI
jgi:hypothetical protein